MKLLHFEQQETMFQIPKMIPIKLILKWTEFWNDWQHCKIIAIGKHPERRFDGLNLTITCRFDSRVCVMRLKKEFTLITSRNYVLRIAS